MADPIITNVDIGQIELGGGQFRDELVTFGAAATLAAGTILARDGTSAKLVPFVKGGSGGEEIPLAVLTYPVTAAEAGDVPVRALVGGVVNGSRLIINADGDDSNIDAVVLDQLRGYAIVADDVKQLAQQDNQ